MKKEFESFELAISWILSKGATKLQLALLRQELYLNHSCSGRYIIQTDLGE